MEWNVEWVPDNKIAFIFDGQRFECEGSAQHAHQLSRMLRDFKEAAEEDVIGEIERSVRHTRAKR